MGDLAGGLLVLLGTAIFIGIIFLVINKRKTDTVQVVQALAARKGWRFEKVSERLASGYRLIGNGWTYEAIKTASSTSSGPDL